MGAASQSFAEHLISRFQRKALRCTATACLLSLSAPQSHNRFLAIELGRRVVALYSFAHRRFVRMNDKSQIDATAPFAADYVPSAATFAAKKEWTWERFTVVDAS